MASQTQASVSLGGTIKKQETINFSSARTTYSFGKDKRFPSVKKPITHAMYDPETSLKTRQIGFGIGNRFKGQESLRERTSKYFLSIYITHFVIISQKIYINLYFQFYSGSPPPGSYTLPSDFDTGKPGSASAQKGG